MRCLSLGLVALSASAHRTYVALNPNGANVPGVAAIGHTNVNGGGPTNSYGSDFGLAGLKWTKDLCAKDSDGDGQSNGVELGDPCCTWVEGYAPLFGNDISNPGDAKSMTARPWYNCSAPQPSPSAQPTSSPGGGGGDDDDGGDGDGTAERIGVPVGAAAGGLLLGAAAMYTAMRGKKKKVGGGDEEEADYSNIDA